MVRVAKNPDARSADLLDAAEQLIAERGLNNLPVEEITRLAGVAKGTFYLHFKSRSALLAALSVRIIERMTVRCTELAEREDQDAVASFVAILANIKSIEQSSLPIAQALHRPENHELHELNNIEFVRQISPIVAKVVSRGCKEGVFNVDYPLETVEFLLSGQAFLLGNPRFEWSEIEYRNRLIATIAAVERALGANSGVLQQPLFALFADEAGNPAEI